MPKITPVLRNEIAVRDAAVRNAIAALANDCKRLSEIGSQGETIGFAQSSLQRILGGIDVVCVLLGKDHSEVERIERLAAFAYFDAITRIEKRDIPALRLANRATINA